MATAALVVVLLATATMGARAASIVGACAGGRLVSLMMLPMVEFTTVGKMAAGEGLMAYSVL